MRITFYYWITPLTFFNVIFSIFILITLAYRQDI